MFPPAGFPDTTATLAFSVFLLTFAYEDGATLLAASLAATGRMDIRIGFLSAFLGIWAGDIGLYVMGSTIGERVVQHRWTRRFVSGNAFAKAQSWFARRGTLAIVMSRFVPGSRLPLYVAAGALKLPARRFSSVTGICAAVWVGAIFVAFRIVPGARLASPARLAAVAFGTLILPWMMGKLFRFALPRPLLLWRKYSRWEFWPAWLFYPPVVAMCAWLALKYRGLALPTIANPSFRNGGIVGESKIEILRALMSTAPELVADGYSLPPAPLSKRVEMLQRLCEQHAIPYPLVLKPNVGQRGAGFKLAASEADAERYLVL